MNNFFIPKSERKNRWIVSYFDKAKGFGGTWNKDIDDDLKFDDREEAEAKCIELTKKMSMRELKMGNIYGVVDNTEGLVLFSGEYLIEDLIKKKREKFISNK